MKKIVFLFAITLLGMACDPEQWVATHATSWYAKNDTDQTLIITASPFIDADAVVDPGDSVLIHRFHPFQYLGEPAFDTFYDAWDGKPEHEWCISVRSIEGRLLKKWEYADRDAAGRQLFDESDWQLYTQKYSHSDALNFIWVFHILPEDIAPLEPLRSCQQTVTTGGPHGPSPHASPSGGVGCAAALRSGCIERPAALSVRLRCRAGALSAGRVGRRNRPIGSRRDA